VGVDEAIAAGRTALADGRWAEAELAFQAALADGEPPDALDGLAEVRYWQGDYAAAIDLHERAYAGFRARGETRHPAVLAAYNLAFDYAAVHGNIAAASGWLERGKRLAKASGDCPERGWVELACVLAASDPIEKERHISEAIEIARRFGDTDLEFDALAYSGVALVEQGRVDEGMRLLDEAAAATRGGEVKNHTAASEIYCKVLLACEMALDVRRAEQWLEAVNSLVKYSNLAWASAICRMYYGGILTAAGRWSEAEQELITSIQIYDGTYRALRSGAVVRLAELRVRQGRLDEAERLLAGHEHDASVVFPLARLRLARGEPELAAALLRRDLKTNNRGIRAAPVLALLAEIDVAADRLDEARTIETRLATIAAQGAVPYLSALAGFVAGIASADRADAVDHLEGALAAFWAAGLPFEEARTRLELARRLAAHQPDLAIAEATAALAVFDRLGAMPDADAADALLRSLGGRGRTRPRRNGPLSSREQEVLALLGLGLSNPEIAARLYISRKTVSHHVSNVLAKLGLRNRVEAATYVRTSAAPLP
jgi:ATP/maltotriose-dependent transcriptional regulator MalT